MGNTIPMLSLFCGAGGLDLGFERAGFSSVLALDVDAVAVETFNANHRPVAVQGDLAECNGDEILAHIVANGEPVPRGVIGGPPCQAFSVGNVRQSNSDPRSDLVGSYADLVCDIDRQSNLDFFVFENVVGINGSRHRSLFGEFLDQMRGAGFSVGYQVLDAVDFGVPQYRRRLIVVGTKTSYPFLFPQPTYREGRTVRDAIGDLPSPVFFDRKLGKDDIPHHPNHWAMVPRSERFFDASLTPGSSRGRSFRVLEWDKPSRTVAYGNREVHVHPSGTRRLAVLEAMLLQGFPFWYTLTGNLSDQIRLVSDVVPPPLAEAIAGAVMLAVNPFDELPPLWSDDEEQLTLRARQGR